VSCTTRIGYDEDSTMFSSYLSDRSEKPGLTDTFVLYIDGIDNIPDNATITKVSPEYVYVFNWWVCFLQDQ